ALVEWITLTPDNLRWTSKHAAHLGQRLAVEIQASDVAHRRPLYDGPERGGVRDPPAGRKARHSDALRDVRILDGDRGRAATRSQKDHRSQDLRVKTRRKTMIRSENLRSGYIQEDVEEYIYRLLPERDPVVKEMEDYAEEHRTPIIGPAVARLLALLVQVSGAKRIFEKIGRASCRERV